MASRNRLLAALSNSDAALLQPHLEPVSLSIGEVLEMPNRVLEHCYFVEYGLAVVFAGNGHRLLEVGLIGCEGMTGVAVVFGTDRSRYRTVIQVAGDAMRVTANNLREAMNESRSLERTLLKFAHSFLNQAANTAVANGVASIEERTARWLLMAHDRLRGNLVPFTHDALSLMLGVHRPGVTVALNYLRKKSLIQLSRGQIVILDRRGLKAAAGGTYYNSAQLASAG